MQENRELPGIESHRVKDEFDKKKVKEQEKRITGKLVCKF